MRILLVIIAFTLICLAPAHAWNSVGHRATASIAFDAMTEETRIGVTTILKQHPRFAEDFATQMPDEVSAGTFTVQSRWILEQAAIWPDQIQLLDDPIKQTYHRGRWHYINHIVYLTDNDQAEGAGDFAPNVATTFEPPLRQNLNSVQALRGNLQVWRDSNASSAEKAVALCWILHIAGDMHQPLHNTALYSRAYFPTGDRGGNSIDVVWGEETINLHYVWDGLPARMSDLKPSSRTLLSIETDSVNDDSIDEWFFSHARLAARFAYPDDVKQQLLSRLMKQKSPQIEVSHEYLVRAESIARRQINLAGHRIAALLE